MHVSAQATLTRTPAAQHAGAVIPPLVTLCHERKQLRKRTCTAAACTVSLDVGVSVLSNPLFPGGRASSNTYARPSADGAPSRARRTAPPQPLRTSAAAARTPTKCGGGAGASRQTTRRPPFGPPHAAQTGAAGPRRMPASSSPHPTAGRPAGLLPQAPAHAAGAAPALLLLATVATSARASAHGHACFAAAPAAGTAGARAGKHSARAALAATRRPGAGRRRGGESEIGEQLHSGAMPPAPARTPASKHCAGRVWTVWLRAPAPGASHGTTCVLQTGGLRHARPVRRARHWPAEASASWAGALPARGVHIGHACARGRTQHTLHSAGGVLALARGSPVRPRPGPCACQRPAARRSGSQLCADPGGAWPKHGRLTGPRSRRIRCIAPAHRPARRSGRHAGTPPTRHCFIRRCVGGTALACRGGVRSGAPLMQQRLTERRRGSPGGDVPGRWRLARCAQAWGSRALARLCRLGCRPVMRHATRPAAPKCRLQVRRAVARRQRPPLGQLLRQIRHKPRPARCRARQASLQPQAAVQIRVRGTVAHERACGSIARL